MTEDGPFAGRGTGRSLALAGRGTGDGNRQQNDSQQKTENSLTTAP